MTIHSAESCTGGPPVASNATGSSSGDPRVVDALEEYLLLMRNGRTPVRAEFLAQHQAIAGALAAGLDGLELVQIVAGEMADPGSEIGASGDPMPSARLGEFRIVREVGRGGMGVVYEAEQLPLGRRVALKVLPSAASLDPRQRQRFQLEAQAAALLHHEHIVPVFGTGFDHGFHYYAMQFIDGRPLTDLIRGLRKSVSPGELARDGDRERRHEATTATFANVPARTVDLGYCQGQSPGKCPESLAHDSSIRLLSPDRRHWHALARFGLQAALALEHAHELGVIHRDIKPSNLLVDARGHLWVTDFGLARLPQENSDVTATGDLVGTLRYMSPEQARGEKGVIDPRVDIYALGATLYELVTLQPAFSAPDRQELLRRILHDEPVAPRRLRPSIPRDLETIILKAMDKEPSARYSSARAMTDDLNRFLDDHPVMARRPSVVDRAVKWSRRHRTPVFAATTTLLLTLAVSVVLLWEAKRRTDKAKARTDTVLQARQQTLVAQRLAIEVSLGTIEHIIRPMVENARAGSPETEEMKRVLSLAISYYNRIPGLLHDHDMMHELVAKVHRQAGYARMSLGMKKGRDEYREAIRAYEELALERPGWIWIRTGLIETLHEYSCALDAADDAPESDAAFRRALELAQGFIGNETAAKNCYSMALAGAFNDLAWTLLHRPEARYGSRALALRLARQAAQWQPGQPDSWFALGVAHYKSGEYSAATAALQKSIELRQGADAAQCFFLAAAHYRGGDAKQARKCFDQAVDWLKRNPRGAKDRDKTWAVALRESRDEARRVLGLPDEANPLDSILFSHSPPPDSKVR